MNPLALAVALIATVAFLDERAARVRRERAEQAARDAEAQHLREAYWHAVLETQPAGPMMTFVPLNPPRRRWWQS